jgi:hypothetical protein
MVRRWLALTLSCVAACSACRSTRGAGSLAAHDTMAAQGATAPLLFAGMCDASGAVPLSGTTFAVADDEDNVLRSYDAARAGAPLASVDISAGAGVVAAARAHGQASAPEIDIEAAAIQGELAYWIGSHGRGSGGKLKRERLRLFATTLPQDGRPLQVVASYDGLLDALLADPRYAAFDLRAAAERAPKEEGGLNIEGLSARREGGLFIAFRNPTPNGKALLAPLGNPEQVLQGAAAELGAPVLIELGGLGIRDIGLWRGSYRIIAGDRDDGAPSRLYRWDGQAAPRRYEGIDLSELNPEALLLPAQGTRALLLSDDGTLEIDGVECKKLNDPRRKRFRAVWVEL